MRERRARLRSVARSGGFEGGVSSALLGGLVREPDVGNEVVDLGEWEPTLEPRHDVDEVLAESLGPERSAGALDDGVRGRESLAGGRRSGEHVVLSSERTSRIARSTRPVSSSNLPSEKHLRRNGS